MHVHVFCGFVKMCYSAGAFFPGPLQIILENCVVRDVYMKSTAFPGHLS